MFQDGGRRASGRTGTRTVNPSQSLTVVKQQSVEYAMDSQTARTVTGVSLVAVGLLSILGFTTAEAFYPGYSTTTQTISALGSAQAPEAAQAVFNGAMVLAGILTVVAALGIRQVVPNRFLAGLVALTGAGVVGVGVAPSDTGLPHTIAALLAFGGTGSIAVVTGRVTDDPFGTVSSVFGGLVLATLALFVFLQGATPLGIGGLERWVAYLGLVWVVAFGGYLLGGGDLGA